MKTGRSSNYFAISDLRRILEYYPKTVTFPSWEVRVYRGFGDRFGRVIRSTRGLVSPKAPGFDEIPAGAATASQKVGFVTIQNPVTFPSRTENARHSKPL